MRRIPMKNKLKNLIQRLVVNTSIPPFTYLYQIIYDLSVRVAALLLRRIDGVLTVYLCRGLAKGEIVYGLSDIDMIVILNDRAEQTVKEKVRTVYDRLSRFIPLMGSGDKELGVYSASEFVNMYQDYDFYRYRFNEGKHTWRLLSGEDVVKNLPPAEESGLYLPATEEMKAWWIFLNDAELDPGSNDSLMKKKYLWYKAIAEAAKIYLLVCQGERTGSRVDALLKLKDYLGSEEQHQIERLRGYLRRLTSREDLISDELMSLFITLTGKAFNEAEKKAFGDSKGGGTIVKVPGRDDITIPDSLLKQAEKLETIHKSELEPCLEMSVLIPQVEFNLDVLTNSDIDSFYLVLVLEKMVPVDKLRKIRSCFSEELLHQKIEPFIVVDGNIALSLRAENPFHCIKSPGRSPLFFSLLQARTSQRKQGLPEAGDDAIQCYMPPKTFEETIRKRAGIIGTTIQNKDIYKMKTTDFLRFFWAAARTKLLVKTLESKEIFIPLTSRQILVRLIRSYPGDSDWLTKLHIEYTKELQDKESECDRFFPEMTGFLKRI